ncbi:MAG: cyclopropane-fatty-acyl-phospholipid synthase family protein [Terrimicrobiaceae bacterium]|nr:cyclopropane-fatty-acyl-phospholipid synthase family protein [Terrimicrobiaceae bacterium]
MPFQSLVLQSFRKFRCGSLALSLPDGSRQVFGGLDKSQTAELTVKDPEFFRRCVLYGAIGFAESYMAGEWDTPNLTRLLAWFIRNAEDAEALQTQGSRSTGAFNLLHLANRLAHLARPNSLRTSRENIRDHYDLSNEFFRLWLDPTMTYSSAYFDPPDSSLEAAQIEKYDRLCRKLRLKSTDHVLEIGSGWGGFSLHAAKTYGSRITTVTISEEQLAEASTRIREAGLADRIEILLADYRTLNGRFDKIVSIEMLEAVGDRYVDGYFAKIDQLLHPHGLAALQAILCPDRQYPILRDGVDFIQKHIFPGSLLMCNARITKAVNRAGNMNLFDYEDMAPHYARTLRIWRENFEARLDDVRALGFDDVFIRKWRYYLCYCEAAFGTRHITVAQIVFSRPDNAGLTSPVYSLP